MKPNSLNRNETTYALLIRSEEKQRGRFETLVYSILIATAFFALAQVVYPGF